MKKCTKCHIVKNDFEFWNKRDSKDKLSYLCKECDSIRYKKQYKENIIERRNKQKLRNHNKRNLNRSNMIKFLTNKKCLDCEEQNLELLEFDHIKGKKIQRVSKMVYENSWTDVLKEIEKCEIVCCNCHRLRTESRKNSYRYRFFMKNDRGNLKKDKALSYLLNKNCFICKNSFGLVLDFHHKNPQQKTAKISDIIRNSSFSLKDLNQEISKCDVVCANCHRTITNKQFGFYKSPASPQRIYI